MQSGDSYIAEETVVVVHQEKTGIIPIAQQPVAIVNVSIHPTAGPKQPHTLSTLNYAGSSVSVRKPQAANLGLLCHWPPCSLKETHAARFHHPLPTVLKEPSWKTMPSFTSDLLHGSLDGIKLSKHHIVHNYLKVPAGIVVVLAILYGVNEIIILTTINFPASVTCMLVLYLALIVSTMTLGKNRTNWIIGLVKIPGDFCLKWINIFFTPAFVTLPLSDWISAKEALTIAAVFVIGYIVQTVVVAYFTIALQKVLGQQRKSDVTRAEELGDLNRNTALNGDSTAVGSSGLAGADDDESYESRRGSLATLQLQRMKTFEAVPHEIADEIARGDEDSIEMRYRDEHEASSNDIASARASDEIVQIHLTTNAKNQTISVPGRAAKPKGHLHNSYDPFTRLQGTWNRLFCERALLKQSRPTPLLSRREWIAQFVHKRFDLLVYFGVFITSLPIYYAVGYEMPLQLMDCGVHLLYRKFLHPVLCSVGLSWLFFFIFAIIKGQNFLDSLREYKTGVTYLRLFNHRNSTSPPGAGDVFATLMDVSIVSLSMPMYTYRMDLKRHFLALLPPILLMTFGCFFVYPPMCYHLGISSQRSIGFAGRSVTLALGTPFVQALDGSIPLMAVTTVISGIIGALTCQWFFKFLRIRDDDYVTRGITLGVNCGAIATAHLLTIDPRAAAMSSLSFVLFGTFMVILASINPLAHLIKGWVGL
ncbi:hypothetical protein BN1211_0636 [Cyberlindnera jadinii]|uniref:LrgB-domain-containing protein n=1 Tax=Cyberlindnera jadinii (strain ATCC 18201 / CBS 1600 / BCRC 20928 / JCM 3617 / NBRC 0987 / NRRL Y-1542) TaxID=983966 RepID=A0A0H5BZD4_CYBJN|nr:hypothetical protein BN1211_0636 [Cyberlindnera jadinii]